MTLTTDNLSARFLMSFRETTSFFGYVHWCLNPDKLYWKNISEQTM